MLRLIGPSVLLGLLCMLGACPAAQEDFGTLVFSREHSKLSLIGGCADPQGPGLWLFVGVGDQSKSSYAHELWFVDLSRDRLDRLEVLDKERVSIGASAGCVIEGETRLAWHLEGGQLALRHLSHSGLGPDISLGGSWEGPAKAAALAEGAVTIVVGNAIGVFDLETETALRHERYWILTGWIDPVTRDVYSIRGAEEAQHDSDLPPVVLARESVLPDGDLRLLAQTDPWTPLELVDRRPEMETYVAYEVVTTNAGSGPGEALVLRNRLSLANPADPDEGEGLMADSTLYVTVRGKGTLADSGTLALETGGLSVMDATVAAGKVVVGGRRYADEPAVVRVLQLDAEGRVQEFAAQHVHNGPTVVDDLKLFTLGSSVYAVAAQWMFREGGDDSSAVTVNMVDVEPTEEWQRR